jgi:hypothetical protein
MSRTYDVRFVHPTGPTIGGEEDVCEVTLTVGVNDDGNAEDIPARCHGCGAALSTDQQTKVEEDAEAQWRDERDWERYDRSYV